MKHEPPPLEQVVTFLRSRADNVSDVQPLVGGAWSHVYAFRCAAGERALKHERVLKLGEHGADYAKDAFAASAVAGAHLPVPRVRERGQAFAMHYAIADFVAGEAFDALPPDRFAVALTALLDVLARLHAMQPSATGYGLWVASDDARTAHGATEDWPRYLHALTRRDDARLRGWREALAGQPRAADVFARGQRLLDRLAPACPSLCRLLHKDLLNGNVRVGADNTITGLLDWGCSVLGDPLYEYADLMFASTWYPALDKETVVEAARRCGGDDVEGRLHCYQLAVALDAIQYQAFAGLVADLEASTAFVESLLDA